jgi:mutator protein MutT
VPSSPRFQHEFPVPIRVLAAVVEKDGRYLVCRRPAHKRHGDLWEFPGGKIESGESDLEAAARELKEELDVEVTGVAEPLFVRADQGSDFVIEFVPTEISGTPQALEHSAIAWVLPSDLGGYEMAPSDRAFAEAHLQPSSWSRQT